MDVIIVPTPQAQTVQKVLHQAPMWLVRKHDSGGTTYAIRMLHGDDHTPEDSLTNMWRITNILIMRELSGDEREIALVEFEGSSAGSAKQVVRADLRAFSDGMFALVSKGATLQWFSGKCDSLLIPSTLCITRSAQRPPQITTRECRLFLGSSEPQLWLIDAPRPLHGLDAIWSWVAG